MTAPALARRPKASSERVRNHAARAATVSVRTLRLRLRRELEALEVRADHYLRRPLREPGLRAMVYFLSLRPLRLPGYDRMLRELLTKAVYSRSTNKGYLAWVSALAEIKAIWLLFKLGLEIQGIEQASPRGRSGKTCDIVAAYPGGGNQHAARCRTTRYDAPKTTSSLTSLTNHPAAGRSRLGGGGGWRRSSDWRPAW